jgi:hypothetical protein
MFHVKHSILKTYCYRNPAYCFKTLTLSNHQTNGNLIWYYISNKPPAFFVSVLLVCTLHLITTSLKKPLPLSTFMVVLFVVGFSTFLRLTLCVYQIVNEQTPKNIP